MSDEGWQGNPAFFGTLSLVERHQMFEGNGVLTGALLERFWRMSDEYRRRRSPSWSERAISTG